MSALKSISTLLRRAGQWLAYVLFCGVELALRLMPVAAVWSLGGLLGKAAFFAAGKYRRLAIANLRIAFGRELSEEQIRDLAWRHFSSLGSNFLCGFKLPLMAEREIVKRVKVEGLEHVAQVVGEGRPLLFAVFHMSCWELLTQVPSLFAFGRKPASIFQPLGNPFINARVRRRREKLGYVLFDRTEGFAGPMKFLRGRDTTIGVLVDQHAGDKGVWCPFFDRLASTTSLPALMSLRCGAPLIPIVIYDNGPARWKLVTCPPIDSGEDEPTAEGITAALNIAAEKIIRRQPHNWFWVHNRWKTPQPAFLLSHYHRGIVWPKNYDRSRLQPFELLVRSPNWLGDACMAFPAVRALKAGRPDLRLTVLAPAKLRDLWASLPQVDEIIAKESGEGLFAVAKRIREKNIRHDAAVLLTNSTRSTLEVWLAGIPRLAGFRGSLRSWLVEQIVPDQSPDMPPEHHARRYLRLAANCGAVTDDPSLFVVGSPAASGDGVVRAGICAGAEYGPAKRWPLERFADTVNLATVQRPGVEWMIFGAPGEHELGERLSALLHGRHVNLAGRTSLAELIARLRECSALLTNDTGTMHLAAALGIPTVSIFGSTEPLLTGPVGAGHIVIRHHVPCSPCFKRECPFGHCECMNSVLPAQAARAVLTVLQPKAG